MREQDTGDVVTGVLNQMDHHARRAKAAILGATAVEGLLLIIALLTVDWADRTHVLVFILSILGYTIVALGLLALGSHVSRVGARVVAALDHRDPR